MSVRSLVFPLSVTDYSGKSISCLISLIQLWLRDLRTVTERYNDSVKMERKGAQEQGFCSVLARVYYPGKRDDPTQECDKRFETRRDPKPAADFSPLCGRLQGNDCDFRRTAEAKRQSDRTDAAVYVELHSVSQPEEALDVFSPQPRQKQRRQERGADLAPVGMPGKHQVD